MPELENKADKIFETLWSDTEFREYVGNNNIPLEFVINLVDTVSELANEQLKQQIEKMKSFIHSEIDFCMYCPLTKECRNEEGTCPYAYATEEEQKNLLMDFINKVAI